MVIMRYRARIMQQGGGPSVDIPREAGRMMDLALHMVEHIGVYGVWTPEGTEECRRRLTVVRELALAEGGAAGGKTEFDGYRADGLRI